MHCSFAFLLVLLACILSLVNAHNINVGPRRRECFYESLHKDDKMTVTFVVSPSQDGNREIDFWITTPSGNAIVRKDRLENGDYSFTATEDGTFRYCFSNEFEGSQGKDVSFNVHGIVYVPHNPDTADPLDREVRALAELLSQVKDEQEYLKIRERTHRNTAESTNSRVKWWSIFQTGVLIGVCGFQVAYLKRFFATS